MAKGDVFKANRTERPSVLAGSRLWTFDPWEGNQYVPYFYNPALDANGQRLILNGERDGATQTYLLDLDTDEVVQLTEAAGSGQNWSPYIREQVSGIRPQFIAWVQPAYGEVVYFEGNTLCMVNTTTLESETLYSMPDGMAPAVLNCSVGGWVAWGYLPTAMQEQMREGASVFDLDVELEASCGFCVYDIAARRLIMDVTVPFWPNHVAASPDHRQILCCHEGLWEKQRMYLYDVEAAQVRPLRLQDDGARIGHEFWIDATTVAYHGSIGEDGFFGTIDVETDKRQERRAAAEAHSYGHYHLSPDGRSIVTDGEVTPDMISVSALEDDQLAFDPVCHHDWARSGDQRVHPHPNWHRDGRQITFTSCDTASDGSIRTRISLLELP
ncbi:MAG: hypothetical protein WKF81_02460 [Thermomicrobiales bacterium]